MEKSIYLPKAAVEEKKTQIYAALVQPDWKSAYNRLLSIISHPSAVARIRLVKGGRRLQRLLNVLILLGRSFVLLVHPFLLIVAILRSWWFLLGNLILLLIGMYAVSPLQIRINVEIAARLFVFDELLASAPDFQEQVIEIIKERDEPGIQGALERSMKMSLEMWLEERWA